MRPIAWLNDSILKRSASALTACLVAPLTASAQHGAVGDFLTPAEVAAVDRQLEHTRDEDGKRLLGWYPQKQRTDAIEFKLDSLSDRIERLNQKLDTIHVPPMRFEDAPAVEVLRWMRSVLKDERKVDPDNGVVIVPKLPRDFLKPKKLSLELKDSTAREALEEFALRVGAKIVVEPFGVAIYEK